jgi:anaphase-promoting complex subunit 4
MAHYILVSAGLELQQFTAFSMWLRHEIDIQAADPTSASAEEAAEKDTMIDHAKVLNYVQGAMTKSRLVEFFQQPSDIEERPQLDLAARDVFV